MMTENVKVKERRADHVIKDRSSSPDPASAQGNETKTVALSRPPAFKAPASSPVPERRAGSNELSGVGMQRVAQLEASMASIERKLADVNAAQQKMIAMIEGAVR